MSENESALITALTKLDAIIVRALTVLLVLFLYCSFVSILRRLVELQLGTDEATDGALVLVLSESE